MLTSFEDMLFATINLRFLCENFYSFLRLAFFVFATNNCNIIALLKPS